MAINKISEDIRRYNARSTIGEVRLVDVKLVNNAEVLPVVDSSGNVLLTTIDADTNAIKTSVEIIDNAVSGNEMQVDIVTTKEFYIEAQKGNVPGHEIVHKFGRNDTVASGVWEGVHQLSTTFNWLTAATTVRVKAGGHANDTAAGSGAQAVTVEGLDNTGAFATEDIELAGALASSATSTLFWRVFRMYITDLRAGAYTGANTAGIILENSAGGTDIITIATEEGQSQHGAYSIPVGKTGYLLDIRVWCDAAKAADFRLYTRESLTDFSTPFAPKRLRLYWDGVLGQESLDPKTPIITLPALTDIWIEAEGGGAQTEVSCDFELILVDD